VVLLPVDLNNLPADDVATFYRVILRAFYESRERFESELQQIIASLYLENRDKSDPFLPQSALRELLLHFKATKTRLVLLLDRFDYFMDMATPAMINSLRGLRDSFKGTLCYIVGMRQEVVYLPQPERLGELYELFDSRVCWLGPMSEADSRQAIASLAATAPTPPIEAEIEALLTLTGGYPALVRATCQWWLDKGRELAPESWANLLLEEPSLRFRLEEIWEGLTQEEQSVLVELQKVAAKPHKYSDKRRTPPDKQYQASVTRLAAKGLCRQTESGWQIEGDLLSEYTRLAAPQTRGRIWWDENTNQFYQGQTPLDKLTSLEGNVLKFLYNHPGCRSKDEIIENCWTDVENFKGVADDNVFQIIRNLRRKIEPNLAKPCYLITITGRGYQLYPEGRPPGSGQDKL
jgi:hypothetical protein